MEHVDPALVEAALQEMPLAYAVALRLHDGGADDETVARALQVPLESVDRLLSIARSKLDTALSHATTEGA